MAGQNMKTSHPGDENLIPGGRVTRAKAFALGLSMENAVPGAPGAPGTLGMKQTAEKHTERSRPALGELINAVNVNVEHARASKYSINTTGTHRTVNPTQPTSRRTDRLHIRHDDPVRDASNRGEIPSNENGKRPLGLFGDRNVPESFPDSAAVTERTAARTAKRPRLDGQDLDVAEPGTELEAETNIPAGSVGSVVSAVSGPAQAWDDLDQEDCDDPLMVSEYVNEIFEYLHELEVKTLPSKDYFQRQAHIKSEMRGILVDWLIEVHSKFRLLPETLFLAVNIMDRFLSVESIEVDRLQLLATSSLFIAAKYEEVFSPSVDHYAYVTDNGFTEEEILDGERFILQVLEFDLSYANPMNFLRRISKADNYDVQTRTIGKYLLEISIVDCRFIGILPSLVCAAAMYLARRMLDRDEWNANLIHYSGGYEEKDILPVVELMIDYLVGPIQNEGFFKKYASKKFMKASILSRQWAKRVMHYNRALQDEDEDDE